MVNRYYKQDPYRGDLYKPPVEFIASALQMAQKQYDTNYVAAQELKNKYATTLPQDRARANEIQTQFESKVDDVVSKFGYDSELPPKSCINYRTSSLKLMVLVEKLALWFRTIQLYKSL